MTHLDWPKFLAAVCAEPDDDLPRLLAADWLDGQGETERAEFIRVQCELAAMPDWHDYGSPEQIETSRRLSHEEKKRLQARRQALRKRELPRHLWVGFDCLNVPEWSPGYSRDGESIEFGQGRFASFSRGFPSRLTLSWQDWQTHAAALLAACPIRRVNRPKKCPDCGPAFNDWLPPCRTCHGTGKVDDWKGDGVVRLTTMPPVAALSWSVRDQNGPVVEWFGREYPGVHFELPRVGGSFTTDIGSLIRGMARQGDLS